MEKKVGGDGFCDSLRMKSERKGRSQEVSSCRAKDVTGGTGYQEQYKRCGSTFSLLVALKERPLG